VAFVALLLSRWGITQSGVVHRITFGLVNRGLADSIHRATIVPTALFLLLQVLAYARLSLTMKHPSRVWPVSVAMVLIGGCILAVVVHMQCFRLGG
jgi:hypothetical protein